MRLAGRPEKRAPARVHDLGPDQGDRERAGVLIGVDGEGGRERECEEEGVGGGEVDLRVDRAQPY